MLKWIIFGSVGLVVVVLVIKVIKTMLKIEKQDKQEVKEEQKQEEYVPNETPVDMRSSSASVVTDMSNNADFDKGQAEYNFDNPTGFSDHADEEFFDYSSHVRNRKGRRRPPKQDFDLDGEFADDFEYQPSNFNYLNPQRRKSNKKKPVSTELNDLSTELKVLMLSDIFDRKFFD